jgi:mRNA-degrading endonuclease RelE of RelBE toxin-antitoxin system
VYEKIYSEDFVKILVKLKKKDPKHFLILMKKIELISNHPLHRFKVLRHDKKGKGRVHIGHFVLIFNFDHSSKKVYFHNYDHHDKIYI